MSAPLRPSRPSQVAMHAEHGRCVTVEQIGVGDDEEWYVDLLDEQPVPIDALGRSHRGPRGKGERLVLRRVRVPRDTLTVNPPGCHSDAEIEEWKRQHRRPDWQRVVKKPANRDLLSKGYRHPAGVPPLGARVAWSEGKAERSGVVIEASGGPKTGTLLVMRCDESSLGESMLCDVPTAACRVIALDTHVEVAA